MSADPLVRLNRDPFRAALDDYLLTLQLEGKSPATLTFYGVALRRLHAFAGPVPPGQIDPPFLRRFLAALQVEGLAAGTQRRYLVSIKTWLKWLQEEGGYGVDAARAARAKSPREVKEPILPFTEDEIQRLFAQCNPRGWQGVRLRAILAVLLDTGIRNSELCGLRLRDVDLEGAQPSIFVRPETDKTRKGRTIALGRRAQRELGRWWTAKRKDEDSHPESPFFIGNTRRGMGQRTLHRLIQRHGLRRGIPAAFPHRFRHTFAILALRAGMNPLTLMHTLGHTDLAMTRRYMAIADSDVSQDKLAKSPLDQLRLKG